MNRVKANLKPKPYFYIYTEGKVTEPKYFKRLLNDLRIKSSGIIGYGKGPKALLEKAKKQQEKAEIEKIDRVWIVFDKDDIPSQDIHSIIKECESKEIGFAFSNPSFELWFLLHFIDCKGKIDNKTLIEKIEENIKSTQKGYKYTKNCIRIFDYLQNLGNRDKAIERASKLNQDSEGYTDYADQNPNTTVHLLVNEILKAQS